MTAERRRVTYLVATVQAAAGVTFIIAPGLWPLGVVMLFLGGVLFAQALGMRPDA